MTLNGVGPAPTQSAEGAPSPTGWMRVFDTFPVAGLLAVEAGNVMATNQAWKDLTGLSESASTGRGWSGVFDAMDLVALDDRLETLKANGDSATVDLRTLIRGTRRWTRWVLRLDDTSGAALVTIAVVDIDAAMIREADLRHHASHDSLTGLLNRAEFFALGREILGRGGLAAVVYVDLDGFKTVNDTAGHLLGDGVLAAAGTRISRAAGPADAVARVGGDEFALLCLGAGESAEVESVAERVRQSFALPIEIAGRPWHIGATVGFAICEAGQTIEELVASADRAMYAAKRAPSLDARRDDIRGRYRSAVERAG